MGRISMLAERREISALPLYYHVPEIRLDRLYTHHASKTGSA